jgi:hypothetical protein
VCNSQTSAAKKENGTAYRRSVATHRRPPRERGLDAEQRDLLARDPGPRRMWGPPWMNSLMVPQRATRKSKCEKEEMSPAIALTLPNNKTRSHRGISEYAYG